MFAVLWLSLSGYAMAAPPGFAERFADVNGTRIRYLVGGKGSAVVLLHGYAQTGHMWNPILPRLAERHTVVVPDLRGAGGSAKPETGYDKKNMAVDVHELVRSLGLERAAIVGHDIGLMVAYAYAAQFPQETERVVLMDAFLPGIGHWKDVWLMRDLWHFHFYGEDSARAGGGTRADLLRALLERLRGRPEAAPSRRPIASSTLRRMRSRAACARASSTSATSSRTPRTSRELAGTPLSMPVLVLTGEKASGQFLIEQARLVATNVKGVVIAGSGHWLIDEAPDQVIPQLVSFLDAAPAAQAQAR